MTSKTKSAPSKGKSTAARGNGAKEQKNKLLSIRDLRVWFELRRFGFGRAGYVRAVDGVNLDLDYGEAIAIVGESGCGKSSLMKTILGINDITEGSVTFEGRSLESMSKEDMAWYRSQVGYVQQDPFGALPPFMTVERILEEPLIIHGIKDKEERLRRIKKVMEEVKLTPQDEFLPKFPHMISGGQQQRIVIARAMILEPKLIVADEPVSMLDASVRVEILRLLRGLQESHNLAVIYITHDLSTVRYFSERILVMYAGQLIEKAEVDNLLKKPKHPYTEALLAATSDPDGANALHFKEVPPGEPPSLVNPPTGCRFHPRCPKFIDGVCDKLDPPEFEPEKGHFTYCWLYDPEHAKKSA
ncbi:MAG: ABC transporter ATP-binding protein [Anaerolineales bacterium]|nr:ABC transporter ATP-binding protein [Anaerolineales bacterium]